ncbi:hypothetical protein PITCH_A1620013 [uncultured Desulfobacterium sp.]|uniref:Carrier domain-containing protein n=1 Tax=uncultured Desulfobacterium sp. TaxID=201089 RepID=A0A445MU90_9BACT|nr:hypothetical protein PITCH_A1620013 [uncultured Desulfobacterium sp.]
MNSSQIHSRIMEFSRIRKDAMDDTAALLDVALFVEEVFGITLSDDDICQENLGTHQLCEAFVNKILGAK